MSPRRSLFLLVLLATPVFAAAPKKKKAPPPPPPPITEPSTKVSEALGDTVLNSMAGATKVQVFRVSDSGGLRPDPAKAIASDFVRGAPGKELDAETLETLKSLLYDDKSFRFEQDVSKCRFAPHLSFQMQSGIGTLEALVSFSCNQVLFILGKPGGRWVPQGTFDMKPSRKKLIDLAKATLPQDAATQKLK
ncbi:MAG: hypothetical protein Q8K32_25770 [Archangium sp.]|nr:hypothetical protein [Archangium sp.]